MANKMNKQLSKLRELSVEELNKKLEEVRRHNFDNRLRHATGQLTKVSELPITRAEVA